MTIKCIICKQLIDFINEEIECNFHCKICHVHTKCYIHNEYWVQYLNCNCILLCNICNKNIDLLTSYRYIKYKEYNYNKYIKNYLFK